MRVLILGSGGREDAFAWKFSEEENVTQIYVSPGNPAMQRLAKTNCIENLDHSNIVTFCKESLIDLVVIGPEGPLTDGMVDLLNAHNINAFGPTKEAARLEGSKIFSKTFMKENSIPTANFEVYESYDSASDALKNWPIEDKGIVIKVDGLAGGKGVVVTKDRQEAEQALFDFMKDPHVSVKTERILFEDILEGEEVSAFALCFVNFNGEPDYLFLGSACDHKRVFDHDLGPNTGGMGCYRDPSWPTKNSLNLIENEVLKPTLRGMKQNGNPFTGFLFMGLMLDGKGKPHVIEYNVRMGDPETQTLLPLINGELSQTLLECVLGEKPDELNLSDKAAVHVVITSGGYPSLGKNPMDLGHVITEPDKVGGVTFYAGVQRDPQERGLLNSGGRVLGVTSTGRSIDEARDLAYASITQFSFKGMHYRKDIGSNKRGQS